MDPDQTVKRNQAHPLEGGKRTITLKARATTCNWAWQAPRLTTRSLFNLCRSCFIRCWVLGDSTDCKDNLLPTRKTFFATICVQLDALLIVFELLLTFMIEGLELEPA